MKNIKGQSMFEVILALFIITLILVAVVILSTSSISNSISSRNKTLASKYTQEAIEWLRSEREADITNFRSKISISNYCLNSLNLNWTNTGVCGSSEIIPETVFLRQVNFTTSLVSGKLIITANVVTSWNDSKGIHEARTITYFTDTRDQ